ncbi:MAG: helix-turn-helix domain-containing protein [bacterium]
MNLRGIALVLGAAQGLFLAAFLLGHKKQNRRANRILAWFLILSTVTIAAPELVRNYYAVLPHLVGATFTIPSLLGPVLFFYVKCLIAGVQSSLYDGHVQSRLRVRKMALIHFLPFLTFTAYLIPFYLQSGNTKIAFFKNATAQGLPLDFMLIWGLQCLHVIAYFGATVRLIQQHSQRLKNSFSYVEKINLRWLRNLIIGNAGLWFLYLGAFILYVFRIEIDPWGVLDYAFGYAMSVLVYGIGYVALRQPEVFSGAKLEPANPQNSRKYERSGLSPEKAEAYARELKNYMVKHQPFKNPELTLQELAAKLSLPPNHLSQIINDNLGQNFFDFINSYRVKAAQQALLDPAGEHLTILAIAYEAGFNSKSAFNAAFKKHAGMSPSQFKKTSSRTRQDDCAG